jgi:hypothetical protein
VQNLLLYAVTRKTAAELITARANPADPHFGLLAWKGDKVRKTDIVVAKNYLTEDEIDTLNRLVVIFLETAELRAKSKQETRMASGRRTWIRSSPPTASLCWPTRARISHEQMEENGRALPRLRRPQKRGSSAADQARRGRAQSAGNQNQTTPQEMTDTNQKQLGNTLWSIADQLRGAMDADDFRDYMLSFLFLRYLSDNYETAAKKELGQGLPHVAR